MGKRTTKAKNYTLKLTEAQLLLISEACELFSRIHMGQLRYVGEVLHKIPDPNWANLKEELERIEPLATGLPRGAHQSISSKEIPDVARIAYDIHQVIRHHVSWQRKPEGGITVNYDLPRKYSAEESLPELYDRRTILK